MFEHATKNFDHKNFAKKKISVESHKMTWVVSRKNKTNCQLYFHDKNLRNWFFQRGRGWTHFNSKFSNSVAQNSCAILFRNFMSQCRFPAESGPNYHCIFQLNFPLITFEINKIDFLRNRRLWNSNWMDSWFDYIIILKLFLLTSKIHN